MSDAGKKEGVKGVKRAKLAKILRKDYVQTAIMVVITVGSVFAFWYGLRFAFKTDHPLWAVASGSMTPTLRKGDLILVQGVQNACRIQAALKDAPEPGDIIVFHQPGNPSELIVHRAVEKEKQGGTWYFTTWGDANSIPDPRPVSEHDVVGKVVGRVPLLGYIALFFEPLYVKVAFILLWIAFLILLEFIPLARKRVKEGQSETKAL